MKDQDNFLPQHIFLKLKKFISNTDFKIIDIGANRKISVIETPQFVTNFLKVENHKLITSFLRESNDGFDNQLNIHADNLIKSEKIALASVLYINEINQATANGTAFYKHEKYGEKLPEDISDEEYNRMLLEDANDKTKWICYHHIASIPNKLLTYDARLFHAKYPLNIDKGNRIVMVNFYSKI